LRAYYDPKTSKARFVSGAEQSDQKEFNAGTGSSSKLSVRPFGYRECSNVYRTFTRLQLRPSDSFRRSRSDRGIPRSRFVWIDHSRIDGDQMQNARNVTGRGEPAIFITNRTKTGIQLKQ